MANPFSLFSDVVVLINVFNLLRALKDLSQQQDPTGRDRALSSRLFQGGVWNCQGGRWSHESRAGKGSGEGVGCGPGVCHPRKNFEIWDAIWCDLVHFGKKLRVLQFSTFVNENIAIMLDSGINIVAFYFNFLVVWMPSVSCCSRRLACSGRVSWSSFIPVAVPTSAYMLTFDNQRL